MIVEMRKVFVASIDADSKRLLERLRKLGVLHLVPVDESRATDDQHSAAMISHFQRAIQMLSAVKPAGTATKLPPTKAVEEVIRIQRESAERDHHLEIIHRQLEEIAPWGNTPTSQIENLQSTGVRIAFFRITPDKISQIEADCVQPLADQSQGKTVLVAAASAGKEPIAPPEATKLAIPEQDRPTLLAQVEKIQREEKADSQLLADIAADLPEITEHLASLQEKAKFTVAHKSGAQEKTLFAVQGWAPAPCAQTLASDLQAAGISVAVTHRVAKDDEIPPTLIQPPKWVRPMTGLMKALGLIPGYREHDVSWAFMLALPIFAGVLIADGGYGLVFLLIPALLYKRISRAITPQLAQLSMIFGVAAILWGTISSSFFGISADDMTSAGGWVGQIGMAWKKLHFIKMDTSDRQAQMLLQKLCFITAAIHLSFAHLWRAVSFWPNVRAVGAVGWAMMMWGMYGVVCMLVLKEQFWGVANRWASPYPWLLFVGMTLATVFACPDRKRPLRGFFIGLASNIFPFISTLSDTISYVRLMAIGLAGSVLAVTFNEMICGIGFLPAVIVLLILGHAMNMALCVLALLAHGVRLNILEFSNNLGMQWSGYPYEPFAAASATEK